MGFLVLVFKNWWLKTWFRSDFSSGKIVRTVSGIRRSGIESIFDLDVTLKKSCMLCQDLKNYKYALLTHFFDLGLCWGLCIQYQDTARPPRTFLVVITASRTLWRGICTSRSIIDTCSREISDPHITESLIFSIRIRHAVNLIDRTDPSGRELSRRTTKSVHKWFLRIKSRSRRFFWYLEAANLFFSNRYMVIALGSWCSYMIQTVKFWSGATAEYIRTDLEWKRSKFQPASKSDFIFYNHVSVPPLCPPLYLKAFAMTKSLSDIQTGG